MYVGWTDERVETLKKLWRDGLTASQIARSIGGLTRSAVIGKAHRIGLAGRVTRDRKRDHLGGMVKPTKDLTKVTKLMCKRQKPSQVRELLRNLPTEPLPPRDTMPAQVSFNNLEAKHCRAITAEHLPFNADRKIYCGERRVPGSSYCECHTRRYMTAISVVKAKQPDRPAWQDTRTGRKGAVFLSGREKMKAY